MAELEFKNLKEAAAHAELQDEKIAALEATVAELKKTAKEDKAPAKEPGADIILKIEGKSYKVKPNAKFRIPGLTITGAELPDNLEVAAKLVAAKVKQIQKA